MNNIIKKFPLVAPLIIIAIGGFIVALSAVTIQMTPKLMEIFLSAVIAIMFLYSFFPSVKVNTETERTSLLLMITAVILTAIKIFLIIMGTKMLTVIILSLLIIVLLTLTITLRRNH